MTETESIAKRLEWLRDGGGEDPLRVQLRQFMPGRLCYSGMIIQVYAFLGFNGTDWVAVDGGIDYDLTTHIPTTIGKKRFVLVSVDSTGAVVLTDGADVDITDTDIVNFPLPPAGTLYVIAAVRTYFGQTSIVENADNTDVHDLRISFWSMNPDLSTFMLKATYDSDDDGSVELADTATSVPWANIPDPPATYAPTDHGHTATGDGGTVEGTVIKSTGESASLVLTTDGSGNASWQPSGGSASAFYGCKISLTLTLLDDTNTLLLFDTESFDEGGYYDVGAATGHVIIPIGKGGKYSLTLINNYSVADGDTVPFDVYTIINSGSASYPRSRGYLNVYDRTINSVTDVYTLNAGDDIEIHAWHKDGGDLFDNHFELILTFLGA